MNSRERRRRAMFPAAPAESRPCVLYGRDEDRRADSRPAPARDRRPRASARRGWDGRPTAPSFAGPIQPCSDRRCAPIDRPRTGADACCRPLAGAIAAGRVRCTVHPKFPLIIPHCFAGRPANLRPQRSISRLAVTSDGLHALLRDQVGTMSAETRGACLVCTWPSQLSRRCRLCTGDAAPAMHSAAIASSDPKALLQHFALHRSERSRDTRRVSRTAQSWVTPRESVARDRIV